MKRKNVKLLLGMLVAVSLLMSFTACGKKESDSSVDAATDVETENSAEAEEETEEEFEDVGLSEMELAEKKMAEPTALRSDIIAGIDQSSVTTQGESTFFSSVMSDGTVVRFEGKNISINEEGITMNTNSEVVSLDAVGKIYIYYANLKDPGMYPDDYLDVGYGYTYCEDKTSVDCADEVHKYSLFGWNSGDWESGDGLSTAYFEPNYVYFQGAGYNTGSMVVTSLTIGYDPTEKVTDIVDICMDEEMYSVYLEGEKYDPTRENRANEEEGSFDFYLWLKPDVAAADESVPENWIRFVPAEFYMVGDLKDSDGKVLNKQDVRVEKGTTLDVTVGDYDLELEIPLYERYRDANTMHDLVPYAFPAAMGEKNALVVPVVWRDQTEMATEERMAQLQKALGNVMDENGNVLDHSDSNDTEFSLSEYFNTASYGKMTVKSFVTDWCYINKTFAEYERMVIDRLFGKEVLNWVKSTYPDLDWKQYDQDGNGYVDSMIIINMGVSQEDSYITDSYGGAVHYRYSYYGDYAGTQEDPEVNCYVSMNQWFLENGETSALIHEFSHNFGLIDYYDVTYSGINAVGGFDMQDDGVGDWNAYSKLAVGWMEPTVIEGLKSGQSQEVTIRSSALAGDVVLIPAAGTTYEGPFSEYMMIDLFSDDGVNIYDTKEYGLKDAVGVRISHVNAWMEKRTMEVPFADNEWKTETYDIGTIHYANNYIGEDSCYNIEIIQAGKTNTFTNLNNEITRLNASDLFYAGDTFSVEEYREFFKDGLLDEGAAFGYTVTVVEIGTDAEGIPTVTLRITAN